jgi:hypothetical protein
MRLSTLAVIWFFSIFGWLVLALKNWAAFCADFFLREVINRSGMYCTFGGQSFQVLVYGGREEDWEIRGFQ